MDVTIPERVYDHADHGTDDQRVPMTHQIVTCTFAFSHIAHRKSISEGKFDGDFLVGLRRFVYSLSVQSCQNWNCDHNITTDIQHRVQVTTTASVMSQKWPADGTEYTCSTCKHRDHVPRTQLNFAGYCGPFVEECK
ncbi:hypothetical protein QTP88_022390 [Uroleucon formosanum]